MKSGRLCKQCGKSHNYAGVYCSKNCEQTGGNAQAKLDVFAAYGGWRCECCGEDHIEFLTIDHINGGGRKDRERYKGTGAFYRHLRSEGFPAGFRVLCMNCNFAKTRGELCPHEYERAYAAAEVKAIPVSELGGTRKLLACLGPNREAHNWI